MPTKPRTSEIVWSASAGLQSDTEMFPDLYWQVTERPLRKHLGFSLKPQMPVLAKLFTSGSKEMDTMYKYLIS